MGQANNKKDTIQKKAYSLSSLFDMRRDVFDKRDQICSYIYIHKHMQSAEGSVKRQHCTKLTKSLQKRRKCWRVVFDNMLTFSYAYNVVINVYAVAEYLSCVSSSFKVCWVSAVLHKSRASNARERANFLIYEFCVPSNIPNDSV